MKILFINSVVKSGSTGNIAYNIADYCFKKNNEVIFAYGRNSKQTIELPSYKITTKFDVFLHACLSRLFDKAGFYSKHATKKLISLIEKEKPDLVNIHNLHGYYLNVPMLLNYLGNHNIKTIFTMHDCWSYTGHCAYYDFAKCDKWMSKCYECPCKHDYPKSLFLDRSTINYKIKKDSFNSFNVDNLVLVTPSEWLKNEVERSFLKKFDCQCIQNGIDISHFKNYSKNANPHFQIIGVASQWTKRKGFQDFVQLRQYLPKDEYDITLIGLTKKQQRICRLKNINGIGKIEQEYLNSRYQQSDLFVNFSYEDNYPTVNLEAIACGTPVLTYKTGGSPESTLGSGIIIEKGNVKQAADAIKNIKKGLLKPEVNNIDLYDLSIEKMCFQYYELFKKVFQK